MKHSYKKHLMIFMIIITIFVCTACSGDDKKNSSNESNDLLDAMTAANMAKYVDQSREAQDKQIYSELIECLHVASVSPDSYEFCKNNAPLIITVNNDGTKIVDKNGEKLDPESAFIKNISDVIGSDFETSMKTKIEGTEYIITMKEDLTIEKTKAP